MKLILRTKALVNVLLQQRRRDLDTRHLTLTIRMVLIGQISTRISARLEESSLLLTLVKSK